MSSKMNHKKRSRRNHYIYFKSDDSKAFHGVNEYGIWTVYKNSKEHHKYDGKGNLIQREEESDD